MLDTTRLAEFVKLADRLADALRHQPILSIGEAQTLADYDAFRTTVLKNTGVSFCTRRHFGRPLPGETQQYLRFAYSGIDVPMIKEGMAKLAVVKLRVWWRSR